MAIQMMKKIWEYINEILKQFRPCFSRDIPFLWFLIVIVGLMTRSDHLGVTSIIRELLLSPNEYDNLIHFFRSNAWKLDNLRWKWIDIIKGSGAIHRIYGIPVLIGDGVKEPKEAFRMPGVKRLRQESENSSKGEYIRGLLFGGLGVLVGGAAKLFCLPISMTIHDGNKAILEWKGSEYKDDSHVTRLVREACKAAMALGETCWLLMDRQFLSGPALKTLAEEDEKAGKKNVIMIAPAKSNYAAWWKPDDTDNKTAGNNEKLTKLGNQFPIMDLFQTKAECFIKANLTIYGELKTVTYMCVNLIWNRDVKQELRFVLVKMDGTKFILACTALDLDPRKIIELYCFRFKIETLFRAFKQVIAGFSCHFWTRRMPDFQPFIKAEKMVALVAEVTADVARESIKDTYDAIEGFVMLSCIAIGVIQLCALKFSAIINNNEKRWMRTLSVGIPSEATVALNLRYALPTLFGKCDDSALVKAIRMRQHTSVVIAENNTDSIKKSA